MIPLRMCEHYTSRNIGHLLTTLARNVMKLALNYIRDNTVSNRYQQQKHNNNNNSVFCWPPQSSPTTKHREMPDRKTDGSNHYRVQIVANEYDVVFASCFYCCQQHRYIGALTNSGRNWRKRAHLLASEVYNRALIQSSKLNYTKPVSKQ